MLIDEKKKTKKNFGDKEMDSESRWRQLNRLSKPSTRLQDRYLVSRFSLWVFYFYRWKISCFLFMCKEWRRKKKQFFSRSHIGVSHRTVIHLYRDLCGLKKWDEFWKSRISIDPKKKKRRWAADRAGNRKKKVERVKSNEREERKSLVMRDFRTGIFSSST